MKLPLSQLLAITSLGFALTMVTNTLEPALLGHKVLELAPEQRNTALGFVTFAGTIVAILIQPIVGALSDQTQSRWGRRVPYFVGGTVLLIILFYMVATASSFALVVIAVLLMQIAFNIVQAPWYALIPDHVPASQRGLASGFKVIAEISALVVGRLIAGELISLYPDLGATAVVATVAVPALILIAALILTTRAVSDGPTTVDAAPHQSLRQVLARSFSVDFRAHPAFGWWFANRMLFWFGFIAMTTFLLFYGIDVLGMTEAEAQSFIGQVSAVLGVALLLFLIPASWLSDRIGRRPLVIAGGLIAGLGLLFLLMSRDRGLIVIGSIIIGIGVGTFMTANWALLTDIVPSDEAARYLGIANIATAGGSAIARLFGGVLIDSLNAATGSTSTGYVALYVLAAACFLLSTLLVLPLRPPDDETEVEPETNLTTRNR